MTSICVANSNRSHSSCGFHKANGECQKRRLMIQFVIELHYSSQYSSIDGEIAESVVCTHTNETYGSLSLNCRNGVGNGDKVTRLRAEALCCKVSDVV